MPGAGTAAPISVRVVTPSRPRSSPRSSLARWKARKSEHCLPLHVDDLDELALAHVVGERRRLVDAQVEPRLGERRRQLDLRLRPRRGALDLHHQRRCRRVAVDDAAAGRGDHERRVARDVERLRRARRVLGPEQDAARARRAAAGRARAGRRGSRRPRRSPPASEARSPGRRPPRPARRGRRDRRRRAPSARRAGPPSGSISVTTSPPCSSTTVAEPGRTHHDS